MAQELQGLLDRIQEEGLKKATEEKEKILAAAKTEAEGQVKAAENEAAVARKKAAEDAMALEERAKAAINQAARDIILALKEDLKKRLAKTVKADIAQTMTPEFMGQVILQMVHNYKGAGSAGLELLVAKNDLDRMTELCRGSLAADLRADPVIRIGQEIGSGLKIGFSGEDVFFDFSDEALSELICSYIGPRLAAVLDSDRN
ncbi:MAG: hypothetical protein PHQ27_00380 [Victivallales bacterium]|nr:hypothetical protein [Victivallales bacterium]